MDPLSVTASLLAILGALSATLETISSLRSAPKELRALLDELSAIRIVCCDVKDLFASRQAGDDKASEHVHLLLRLSNRSRVKLNEIDELMKISGLPGIKGAGDRDLPKLPKVARLRWVKVRKRLKAMREEMREIRSQFAACVGKLTSSDVSQVAAQLEEANNNSITRNLARREEHNLVTGMLNEHRILLGSILDELLDKKETPGELSRRFSDQNTLVDVPPDHVRTLGTHLHNSTAPPTCLCKRRSKGTEWCPETFRQVIGRLIVRYSRAPDLVASCSDPDCKKGGQARRQAVSFTYYFPTWLCTRRILGRFVYSSASGPEFLLRVPNIVPSNSDVLNFARTGNVPGLQHLFSSGLASPHDANSCGLTALHLAIHRGFVETSRFLIYAGADIYGTDEHDNKPIDTAWKLILSKRTSDTTTLEQLFSFSPASDYAGTRQFSTAHRAVLKLGCLNTSLLPELISQVPEMKVDATDAWGMTALGWAAQINDAEAVDTLLCLGADPNKSDGRYYTPLMRTTDPWSMKLLLDAGASVDLRDNLHQTALFAATQSPDCVEMLIHHGASINLTEKSHGLTAAHFCAYNNRADSLRVLLKHGADFRVRSVDGNNLLHTAAKVSDSRTLEVLVEAAEAGIVWDTQDINDEGATFRMLAERHMGRDPKAGAMLRKLLTAVGTSNDCGPFSL